MEPEEMNVGLGVFATDKVGGQGLHGDSEAWMVKKSLTLEILSRWNWQDGDTK